MTLLFGHILSAFLLLLPDGTDIHRLSYAVAMAETQDCQSGVGRYNNCFGIRRNGKFVRYETKEDSYEDFQRIWREYYGRYPTLKDAQRYTAGEGKDWLEIVNYYY